jgi:arylsulfatase A-like enzyme
MKLEWPASVVQVVVPAGLLLAIGEGLRLVLLNDASELGLSPAVVAIGLVLCGTAITAILGVFGAELLSVALPEAATTRRLWLVRGALFVLLLGPCFVFARSVLSGTGVTLALGAAKPTVVALTAAIFAATPLLATPLLRGYLRWIASKPLSKRWPLAVVFVVLAVACDAANRRLFVGLYDWAHSSLAAFTALGIALGLATLRPVRPLAPRVTAALWAALLLVAAVGATDVSSRLAADSQTLARVLDATTVAREVLRVTWAASDFDGDGYSALWQGGDCDDGNPAVHVGAMDVPDNGLDEDCRGGDLSLGGSAAAPQQDSAGSEQPAPSSAPAVDLPDILILSLDGIQPGHLGCYGYSKPQTPNIDAIAARGTRFTRAYTSSPQTWTTLPAMLTGVSYERLYPNVHPGFGKTTARKHPPVPSLMTELAGAGYLSLISAQVWPAWDFAEDPEVEHVPAPPSALQERLSKEPQEPNRPLAYFAHYMGTHRAHAANFRAEMATGLSVGNAKAREKLASLLEDYDETIAKADAYVGAFIELQKSRGRWDNTVIVVTADHGEEYGEHGSLGHGRTLYEETIRVPLLVVTPRSKPRVVDAPVTLLDLAPTIRDLAGLPPTVESEGRSLVPYLEGESRTDWPILVRAPMHHAKAVLYRGWKLILPHQSRELYDLKRDPEERRNLVDAHPRRVTALSDLMSACAQMGCANVPEAFLAKTRRVLGR